MAADDAVSIITTSHLTKLQRRSKIWWLGWILAAGVVAAGTYQVGRLNGRLDEYSKLQAYEARLVGIENAQNIIVEKFVKAWEGNNQIAEVLATWAEYNKDRAAIVHQNASAKR